LRKGSVQASPPPLPALDPVPQFRRRKIAKVLPACKELPVLQEEVGGKVERTRIGQTQRLSKGASKFINTEKTIESIVCEVNRQFSLGGALQEMRVFMRLHQEGKTK
jgi:hypothetical protein